MRKRSAALLGCSFLAFALTLHADSVDVSGTWTGSFTWLMIGCGTLPPTAYPGSISATLTQTGTDVTGMVTFVGLKSDEKDPSGKCVISTEPTTNFPLRGQIAGSTFVGELIDSDAARDHSRFDAAISGNTISGSFSVGFYVFYPGESFTFELTRTTPPPAVLRFLKPKSEDSSLRV